MRPRWPHYFGRTIAPLHTEKTVFRHTMRLCKANSAAARRGDRSSRPSGLLNALGLPLERVVKDECEPHTCLSKLYAHVRHGRRDAVVGQPEIPLGIGQGELRIGIVLSRRRMMRWLGTLTIPSRSVSASSRYS